MRLLRAADHHRVPWKNGGGETLEVAISPGDAGADTFDWRVSMAMVAVDGPFSIFPGVDRTLVILEGEGIRLDIAGRAAVALTPASTPYAFPGDVATSAVLTDGAITDLNVMTARARYAHTVERFVATRELRTGALETLLLLGTGAMVAIGSHHVALGPRDLVLLEAGETARVRPAEGTACLLVTIRPHG